MRRTDKDIFADISRLKKQSIAPGVLESVLHLCIEIAREGREGRKIGTMLIVGDTNRVLERSRPLILDPLYGHPDEKKRVADSDMRESVKELAQLDGAFVVSGEGIVVSAARYIDVSSKGVTIALGLGSRHMAAASITHSTEAVAVVVSESGIVRVFDKGKLISEIIPEIWMTKQHGVRLGREPVHERSDDNMVVLTRKEPNEKSTQKEVRY